MDDLGLDEALEESALVVEWGERLPQAYLADALTLSFEHVGPEERRIRATAGDDRSAVLLEAWNALQPGARA